jgi:S1-C subfamily serine protease
MKTHRTFPKIAVAITTGIAILTLLFAITGPLGNPTYAESTKQQLQDLSAAFRDVAKEVGPSVVYISTEQTVKGNQMPGGNMFDDEFFRRFFGIPEDNEREYKRQWLGSGFVVR